MLGIETIKITPKVLAQACEVDEFKGVWTGLETYTTSLQVLNEVAQFGRNFQRTLGPLKEQAFTTQMICALHASHIKNEKAGFFKSEVNQLVIMSGDEVVGELETAAPEDVSPIMEKLVEWLNMALERRDLHPLVTIAVFMSVFLQIGPFADGNMRIARFLVMLLLLKSGYSYAPYVPLDKIMNDKAEEVYRALKHNQDSLEAGRPDWSEWLNCFLMIMQEQADVLRSRLNSKDKEMSNLPTLSAKILALFEKHQRLQMKEIIKLTNGRRSTIKLRLGELTDGGYLRRHGQARSTWYSLV